MYHGACVQAREQFLGVGSLPQLCHVEPGDQLQVVRLGGKHFFSKSHFCSPWPRFLNTDLHTGPELRNSNFHS